MLRLSACRGSAGAGRPSSSNIESITCAVGRESHGARDKVRAAIAKLEALRDRFEREFGIRTNTVLGNLYRDGRDSMGWHRDHEPELGPDPHVVSLSLGASRDFDVRRDADRLTQRFALGHGDLILMGTESQTKWTHSIPKRLKIKKLRINLTFRQVIC